MLRVSEGDGLEKTVMNQTLMRESLKVVLAELSTLS
jgi:hypothetical protein